MATLNKEELLKNPKVKAEIDRYKWCESEKAGHDIGIDKAVNDWFKIHAEKWVAKNLPAPKKTPTFKLF
ncbi:MAG: hypothetical protein HQL26_05315 [Candidatus Omnitrophica bacterium]|nr:hypothetical protein [Candidatus Omnitrophota bacterium]